MLVDVEKITLSLQEKFRTIQESISIAVMGCVVNGPGEAKEADIALIGGKEECLIYINGKFSKKVKLKNVLIEMEKAVEAFISCLNESQ